VRLERNPLVGDHDVRFVIPKGHVAVLEIDNWIERYEVVVSERDLGIKPRYYV
jgi:hypothetical protein